MSAYLLLNPTMPTTIADELEAFLHVLVYGCIRRVRSNLRNIHAFLTDYFAGGSFDPKYDQAACPSAKRDSVVSGQILRMTTRDIVFTTPDGKLSKRHPLNALISELLAVFHSRYAILEWEARAETTGSPESLHKTKNKRTWGIGYKTPSQDVLDMSMRQKGQAKSQIKPPTPVMYDNVKALDNHATIIDIFNSVVESDAWPDDDVVPDRQAEPRIEKAPRRLPAILRAAKREVSPIPEVDEALDVPIPDANAVPLPPDSPAAEGSNPTTVRKTVRYELDAPLERPRKRRRKDPVVQEADANIIPQAVDTEFPMRRVTRSRTAATAQVQRPAPAPAPAPAAQPPPARQPTTAAPSARVTRSRSGKLPNGNTTGRAGASTSSGGPTRRGRSSRPAAADRPQTTSRPARRQRGGETSQSTANKGGSRRTRRS